MARRRRARGEVNAHDAGVRFHEKAVDNAGTHVGIWELAEVDGDFTAATAGSLSDDAIISGITGGSPLLLTVHARVMRPDDLGVPMIDPIASAAVDTSAPGRVTDSAQARHPGLDHSDSWGSTLAMAGLVIALVILGLVLA